MITILGTGQVGRAILDQLQDMKVESDVLLVNRGGKVDFELPIGVSVLGTDATQAENLVHIFRKSQIVFSCTDVPYQFWAKFYPALSIAMIEGLKKSNAKLIFADNMYSYGNLKGEIMHEDLEHNAQTHKGKIRASIIKNFELNELSNRVAIVKSSDFIGPRVEKGIFGVDFLKNIYNHKTINLLGKTNIPHHFTFIEDFAKTMVMLAFEKNAYGHIWHVPNAAAITQGEWIDIFKQKTGLKIKYQSIPKVVIRLAGLFNPFIKELNELSYQFEYPYLVSSQKFIEKFGDISTKPYEIVSKTVQWFNLTLQKK